MAAIRSDRRSDPLSAVFRRPEVHSDVIFGVVVDLTDVKVPVKFGDSRLNRSRDIRLPHFVRTTTSTTPAYAGHDIRRFA